MTAYLFLTLAIISEVGGTMCMKLSNGLTKWPFAVGMAACYAVSLYSVTVTLKYIEIGKTYAIWAGLGTALVAVIGIIYFKEELSWIKVGSIALIIFGVIGLNLTSNVH